MVYDVVKFNVKKSCEGFVNELDRPVVVDDPVCSVVRNARYERGYVISEFISEVDYAALSSAADEFFNERSGIFFIGKRLYQGHHLRIEYCRDCLTQIQGADDIFAALIIHSDRGSDYRTNGRISENSFDEIHYIVAGQLIFEKQIEEYFEFNVDNGVQNSRQLRNDEIVTSVRKTAASKRSQRLAYGKVAELFVEFADHVFKFVFGVLEFVLFKTYDRKEIPLQESADEFVDFGSARYGIRRRVVSENKGEKVSDGYLFNRVGQILIALFRGDKVGESQIQKIGESAVGDFIARLPNGADFLGVYEFAERYVFD